MSTAEESRPTGETDGFLTAGEPEPETTPLARLRAAGIVAGGATTTHGGGLANARKRECPDGHSLTDPANLVPAKARIGQRNCLACSRLLANEQHRMVTAAARALGLTRSEYVALFGEGRPRANAILRGAL